MGRLGYYSKLSFQALKEVIPKKIFAGGRGQRNREEIGAGLFARPFVRAFAASPLSGAPDKTAMLRRLQ